MAKISAQDLIASLKEMTILEINDLIKAIEEEFGVSAAAPVAVAGAAAGADAGAAAGAACGGYAAGVCGRNPGGTGAGPAEAGIVGAGVWGRFCVGLCATDGFFI